MGHFSGKSHCGRIRTGILMADKGSFFEPSAAGPSHHDIALLAYSYWESRGRQGGSPDDDWYRAEAELKRLRR